MKDYKMLAIYYLKHNKRRSMLTIFGVAIAVIVLYAILNVSLDQMIVNRDAVRAEADYDLMLFTQNETEINEITAMREVKEAYVGEAYDEKTDTLYENGLYVSLKNPYRMQKILEKINTQFNVEGDINSPLAVYYLQLGEDNMIFIMIMVVLLLSYIFAIFGVGIIRNSIQLYSLEQIKDYGILRCIGATKKQLRAYVYTMGAVLEILGIILGIVIGYPVCLLIGIYFRRVIGFHFLPIVLILFVFLGDMYFVMQENCKFVNGLTPISAVRGEFRIKKEKIKVRSTKGIRKFLGMEGEYAYKSLMRNKGRFLKSVCAIGIGIGAFISMASSLAIANNRLKTEEERYGEYQVYYYSIIEPDMDTDEVERSLPNEQLLTSISEEKSVEKAKRMYISSIYATSPEMVTGKLSKEYIENTMGGDTLYRIYHKETDKEWINSLLSNVSLWGLDDEDYAKFQDSLISGTLDISDYGIVLVGRKMEEELTEEETLDISYGTYTVTDYQIGDTIDIVNPEKLRELVQMKSASNEDEEGGIYHSVIEECRQELIAAGDYTTYTIEGIVEQDYLTPTEPISFILPIENYYKATGLSEKDVSGMKYSMDSNKVSLDMIESLLTAEEEAGCIYSGYSEVALLLVTVKKEIRYIALFVIFIVSLSTINIINTTAGNLHLRRKEFAQLRVIGISKKRLTYMVMLEGIITTFFANIVGNAIGLGIAYYIYSLFALAFNVDFAIPWLAILIGLLVSICIFCGSIYVPLKNLPVSMAEDLTTDGD